MDAKTIACDHAAHRIFLSIRDGQSYCEGCGERRPLSAWDAQRERDRGLKVTPNNQHAPFGKDFDPLEIPFGHFDPSSENVRTILHLRESQAAQAAQE